MFAGKTVAWWIGCDMWQKSRRKILHVTIKCVCISVSSIKLFCLINLAWNVCFSVTVYLKK